MCARARAALSSYQSQFNFCFLPLFAKTRSLLAVRVCAYSESRWESAVAHEKHVFMGDGAFPLAGWYSRTSAGVCGAVAVFSEVVVEKYLSCERCVHTSSHFESCTHSLGGRRGLNATQHGRHASRLVAGGSTRGWWCLGTCASRSDGGLP